MPKYGLSTKTKGTIVFSVKFYARWTPPCPKTRKKARERDWSQVEPITRGSTPRKAPQRHRHRRSPRPQHQTRPFLGHLSPNEGHQRLQRQILHKTHPPEPQKTHPKPRTRPFESPAEHHRQPTSAAPTTHLDADKTTLFRRPGATQPPPSESASKTAQDRLLRAQKEALEAANEAETTSSSKSPTPLLSRPNRQPASLGDADLRPRRTKSTAFSASQRDAASTTVFSIRNAAQRCIIRRKRRITDEEQTVASREADHQHHDTTGTDRQTVRRPAAQKAPFLVPPSPKQTAASNSASKTVLVRLSSGQKGPPEAFQRKGCMAARAACQRRSPGHGHFARRGQTSPVLQPRSTSASPTPAMSCHPLCLFSLKFWAKTANHSQRTTSFCPRQTDPQPPHAQRRRTPWSQRPTSTNIGRPPTYLRHFLTK